MNDTDRLIAQRLRTAEVVIATAQQSIDSNQKVITRELAYIDRLRAKLGSANLTNEFTPIPSSGRSG